MGQVSVGTSATSSATAQWRDTRLSPAERAEALIPLMTLEEKAAQLVGVWVGVDASGNGVAPHQADMADGLPWSTIIRHGLGQLTRPYGTAPVDPVLGARSLAKSQAEIVAASRFGTPARVHEECRTGFATWRATVHPAPLAWGASFDPELVEEMADVILPPFEIALLLGGARSVMHSYAEIDGVPAAAGSDVYVLAVGDRSGLFGRSSADVRAAVPLRLVGDGREVGHQRRLQPLARADRTTPPPRTTGEARG